MNEVAGPIVEGLDDNFLADLFDKMRIGSPPQQEVDPGGSPGRSR